MQEFVLFVLGDVLYLSPKFQIASADVLSIFGSLMCRSLFCCVSDDLRGSSTRESLKEVVCFNQILVCFNHILVALNMEGAKNKSS